MVDPVNITNFSRSDYELEEFACFAVLVAGKTAKTIAPRLEKVLEGSRKNPSYSPLYYLGYLKGMGSESLAGLLKRHGIGCFNQKAETIMQLTDYILRGVIDLRTCEPWQMEIVKGIGLKTSRFFILHSRANARIAALDTHILKGLRAYLPMNIHVPTSTPSNPKEYRRLENHFLMIADQMGLTPAELDLMWWREYSGNVVL
jgi:thermostable 8-oxoguanine DNA glycosylase